LISVIKLVFELQLLFDVAVTKEFTDDLCSVNTFTLSSTEVINCILRDKEIYGKQNEPSFNLVHPCIGKV